MSNSPTPVTQPGQVITFYSYKGGVGRTMAMANVACLLAQAQVDENDSRGVLVVDWDLEAPGLHRFFGDYFTRHFHQSKVTDEILNEQLGLIDLMTELNHAASTPDLSDAEQDEDIAQELVSRIELQKYIIKTDVPQLSLLKAGRRDESYWQRVNTFPWEGLFKRSPYLYRALAERWAAEYRYVLIDSRTGETDTSGVCTMIMPEKLVVVFTPNQQSLQGVRDLAERALRYRRGSDDLRNLAVFPLPSRIEASETELRENWRKNDSYGYQPMFERLFRATFDLKKCDLNEYFDEVQIQHKSRYSYGEAIAMLVESRSDRLSLTRSYSDFTKRLIGTRHPWKQEETTLADNPAAKLSLVAESKLKEFSEAEQQLLMRALTRLVRVAGPNEVGEDAAQAVALKDFEQAEIEPLRRLATAGVLNIQRNDDTQAEVVNFAESSLVSQWDRLQEQVRNNRDFLLWRQRLQGQIAEWQAGRGAHLIGPALTTAREHLAARPDELNDTESAYITQSVHTVATQSNKRRRMYIAVASIILVGLVVIASLVLLSHKQSTEVEAEALANEGRIAAQNADYDQAVNKYKEALAKGADPVLTSVSLGEAQDALRNDDEALVAFSAALERDPKSNAALLGRAQVYLRSGDYDKAIGDFDQVVKSNPADARVLAAALRGRGEAELRKGDQEKAIATQSQAITLEPDNAASYLSRATAYQSKGTHTTKEATADFQQALTLSRDDQITESARQGLVLLRALPKETPTPTILATVTPAMTSKAAQDVVTRIYLHYQDKDDLATVRALGKALSGYGKVQGAEFVTQPTTGDVRYYYPEDSDNAAKIRAATQAFLAKQGSPLKITTRYPRGLSSKVARGWIEVWIPSLKAAKNDSDKPIDANSPRNVLPRQALPDAKGGDDAYGKAPPKNYSKKN